MTFEVKVIVCEVRMFYVMYISDLLSPTKKSSRRMSIPGLQDRESQIMDPWSSLFKLLVLIGQNLGWDVEIEFFSKSR